MESLGAQTRADFVLTGEPSWVLLGRTGAEQERAPLQGTRAQVCSRRWGQQRTLPPSPSVLFQEAKALAPGGMAASPSSPWATGGGSKQNRPTSAAKDLLPEGLEEPWTQQNSVATKRGAENCLLSRLTTDTGRAGCLGSRAGTPRRSHVHRAA